MINDLFQKKPEYDENGQLVGYSQPKIVWIILALVVLYCFKDKLMKHKGGGLKFRNYVVIILSFLFLFIVLGSITLGSIDFIFTFITHNHSPSLRKMINSGYGIIMNGVKFLAIVIIGAAVAAFAL